MIKYFRHLRTGCDEIFTTYALTREASLQDRPHLYSAGTSEKIQRAISFRPGWLDLFISPIQTIFTLRAREKYTEAIAKGATSSEFATYFDDLVKACSKQKFGIKANFESTLLIFEMEDRLDSVKKVRSTLADSRVFSDKYGVIKFSEHHYFVDFVAKTGAILLAGVDIGLFFVFLHEVMLSDCIQACSIFGAIEVFFFTSVVFNAFFYVGYRKSNLGLLVEILSNQRSDSPTTASESFLIGFRT